MTKVGIVQPCDFEHVHEWTHKSMLGLHKPYDLFIADTPKSAVMSSGADIAEKREKMTADCLKAECEVVVYMDADQVYPQNALVDMVERVLGHDADMVSILCYRGYDPFEPLIWNKDCTRLLKPFADFNFGDVVEAGQVGLGCVAVDKRVFAGVSRPWFRIVIEQEKRGIPGFRKAQRVWIRRGEDTYFTSRVTRSGFKLIVLTEYDIPHDRHIAIDRHTWALRAAASRLGSWDMVMKLAAGDYDSVITHLQELKQPGAA